MEYTFKRKNHLKSKSNIDLLFSKGKTLNKSPLRFVFLEMESENFVGVQVLMSVPKKRFKLAVSRNRIRRIMSEAYRIKSVCLQKKIQSKSTYLALAIIYNGSEIPDYQSIEPLMEAALRALNQLLFKSTNGK